MPFYPGISKHLTDEQLWTIVCADPSLKLRQLAQLVGAVPSTVNSARWRVRKLGWTCRVSYGICRYCGKPFTRQGTTQLRLAYHPACHPLTEQHYRCAPDRRRWEALTVEERRDSLAGPHLHRAEHQEAP